MAVLVLLAISVRAADAASPGYHFRILVQTGDTIGGKTLTGISSPVLNDSGAVAFHGTFSDGAGIFTPTELLARSGYFDDNGKFVGEIIDGKFLLGIGVVRPDVAMNNAGAVVFGANFFDPANEQPGGTQGGIFSPSKLLAQGPFGSLVNPRINDRGNLVFLQSPGFDESCIATPSGVLPGTCFSFMGNLVLNNSGEMAFDWAEVSYPSGIIAREGVSTMPLLGGAGTGDTITSYTLGSPGIGGLFGGNDTGGAYCLALNDSGSLVFIGWGPFGSGIFTSSERLVASGDTIGGQKLYVGLSEPPSYGNMGVAPPSTRRAQWCLRQHCLDHSTVASRVEAFTGLI